MKKEIPKTPDTGNNKFSVLTSLQSCESCPRRCKVNRLAGEVGVCGVGRYAVVNSAFAHFGEESVLVGRRGSGTIFFSKCNLLCRFCQNYEVSHGRYGRELTEEALANLMLELQEEGLTNINLVTPSHVVLQLVVAIGLAKDKGLKIPVVYNTSAYDTIESLQLLEGLVDIYMPDFKFWSEELAWEYLKTRDYPEVARKAIQEMHRQVGDLVIGDDGVAKKGLLVRHLVMPNATEDADKIMAFLAEISKDTYVNIMAQYRPMGYAHMHPKIARRPTFEEVEAVYWSARRAGLWRFDK